MGDRTGTDRTRPSRGPNGRRDRINREDGGDSTDGNGDGDRSGRHTRVSPSRRDVLKALSLAGAGGAVFGRALVALAAEKGRVTDEMIRQAEWISGLDLPAEKRALMLDGLSDALAGFDRLRAVELDNGVAPAFTFEADPGGRHATEPVRDLSPAPARPASAAPARPSSDEDLAFATITTLGALLRSRKISSVELTRLYLDRLRRFDPILQCVITTTEDLALRQAERADIELAAGGIRGPLHGIPWGAKDLLAVPGYRTTWGAEPYRDQMRSEKAEAVSRLEDAGGVLAAKLTLGALAWGDVWFGGTTKNPWKTDQGSSGSSAGSASATAAGLVGYALGTETWGSIVSPSTVCGATGLRPTFGRVSRYGAMALAWTMDKIGPITRSVEDCATVFGAIHGTDPKDPSTVDRSYDWPLGADPRSLRVGFVEALFDEDYTKWADTDDEKPGLAEWKAIDHETLETLRRIGFKLVPVKLPEELPIEPLSTILTAEAAAAFDELTRSGRDDLLKRQIANAWPTVFRVGQMIPAVEYLRASRIRSLVMAAMDRMMDDIDVYVVPSFGGNNLLLTNLTGHPAVVLPNGFRPSDGTPTSITFQADLFREADALAVADLYQRETGFHLKRPPLAAP